LLALNRHNLPTTDLKRALERLRQIRSNKQGVDVRQTLNEAIKHMRRAETSLAGAYELRAQQIADGTFKEAHEADTTGGTVPAGYENMVSKYFKAVAEESARQK
jgi:isopropylmalate/homocitrate/citramalate synthase